VVEAEDFEVRYDQIKQSSFLFKEEDLAAGAKKKYSIGLWIFGLLTKRVLTICVPAQNMLLISKRFQIWKTVPKY